MYTSNCQTCGNKISVLYQSKIRLFCNKSCAGIANTKGQFKKGYISWNKGLRGYNSGEKHWHWKGGVTPINRMIRTSSDYMEWRIKVLRRDNFTCTMCGVKNGMGRKVVFHIDHIKPFATHPELRLDINNGRTLCKDCHKLTDSFGVKNINQNYVNIHGAA